jgi:hypothetical protein
MQDRPPTREELAQRIRDQIEAVQQATQDATGPRQGTDAPTTPRPDVVVTRVPWDPNNFDIPPRVAELGKAFFITVFAIIVFVPIARAIGRWIDRRAQAPARPSAQVTAQLTQLTQSVDAIAIEVERISEGQRFTTKLLSDLQAKRGSMLPAEAVGSRAAE